MPTLTINIPEERMQWLQDVAARNDMTVAGYIAWLLADEQEADELENTPNEKIIEGLRRAVDELNAGQTRPASELFAEIRAEEEAEEAAWLAEQERLEAEDRARYANNS